MKKIFIFVLSLMVAFSSLWGCGSGSDNGNKQEKTDDKIYNGEITFWSAPTAETVLLKKDISFYAGIRKDARIDVEMAKNEYEGAQIFLTATEEVGEYYIDKSDLKNENGKSFSSDNIDVYAYKYIETTFNTASHRNIGIGHYPDAILPIDASVKFGENKIEKGANQGIYVRFHTLPDTDAGTYTGKITVRYDGKSREIPVTVNVWDVKVSETTRSKTLFSNKWNWESPELDSTDERFQSYIDLLSEYRIGSINLINMNDRDRADMDALSKIYADKVYAYANNPRNSVYAIDYFLSADSFDKDAFIKFVVAIAEKSFETGFNCLTKAVTYFGMLIDEATMQDKLDETKAVTDDYRYVLQSSYDTIMANKSQYIEEYGVSADFVEELAESARHIPHIFVANYNEEYAQYIDKDGTGTGHWCPNVYTFLNDETVEKFMEIGLDWWYGCGGSSKYIPSYQLDDYTLSPRIMSWQQIYYGIEGNLYWSTNLNYNWENNWYVDKEDYYTGAVGRPGVLGDGQLTYPGGQYELSRPVATRRLEAIRDGLEEYELLLDLKNRYAEIAQESNCDFTFDKIYAFITANLFDGININASADAFDTSRNLMFQLLTLANSAAGLCVTDLDITTTQINGTCFLKDGYTLKLNGDALSGKSAGGSGQLYSFAFNLNDYVNSCVLSVPELSGYNALTVTNNGKAVYYGAESTFDNFKNGYVDIEKSLVNASVSGINGAKSEQVVKVKVNGFAEGGWQAFKYTDEHVKQLGEFTSGMTLRIYNGSGSVQDLSIDVKYKGESILSSIAYAKLQVGWNTIEIKGIDQKNWSQLIGIDYMLFSFGETGQGSRPDIDDLYFDGYYITYLKELG